MFKIPTFSNPVLSCYNLKIDLQYPSTALGLGDVIFPGNARWAKCIENVLCFV